MREIVPNLLGYPLTSSLVRGIDSMSFFLLMFWQWSSVSCGKAALFYYLCCRPRAGFAIVVIVVIVALAVLVVLGGGAGFSRRAEPRELNCRRESAS